MKNVKKSALSKAPGERFLKAFATRTLAEAGVELGLSPGDLVSTPVHQLWLMWQDAGYPFGSTGTTKHAAFAAYRAARTTLKVGDLPHDPVWIRRAIDHVRPGPLTRERLHRVLGKMTEQDFNRALVMAGETPVKITRVGIEGKSADLYALVPAVMRGGILQMLLKAGRFADRPLNPRHIGRTLQLPYWLQPIAVCSLLRYASGGCSIATVRADLTYLETGEELFVDPLQADFTEQLERYWSQRSVDDEPVRARRIKGILSPLGAAEKWLVELGPWTGSLVGLLPRTNLSFQTRSEVSRAVKQCLADRGESRGKKVAARPLSPQNMRLRLDARLDQVRELARATRVALADMPEGCPRPFDFDVEIAVVRRDGTVVPRVTQIMKMRLQRPDQLLRETWRTDPSLGHRETARVAANGGWARAGLSADDVPLVLYLGVEPKAVGEACIEPFFVDLYRWGVCESDLFHSPAIEAGRHKVLIDAGFERLHWSPIDGLFCFPPELRSVAKLIRGSKDPHQIAIPAPGLLIGMLMGRLAYQVASKGGARSFEILQIKLGADGSTDVPVEGGYLYFLRMRPKNGRDLADFPVDEATVDLIKELAAELGRRWFPTYHDGERQCLPVRPVAFHGRYSDIDEGEFVFQNINRCVDIDELNVLVNLAMFGLDYRHNHDDRFSKVTRLGTVKSIPKRTQKKFFNWSEASTTIDHYDRSDGLADDDLAAQFAEPDSDGAT